MIEARRTALWRRFDYLAKLHASLLGVGWTPGPHDDACTTMGFWSFRNYSGIKGRGRQVMRDVCALADSLKLRLRLSTDVPKLYSYYESFGFHHVIEGQPEWGSATVRWYYREFGL